MRKIIETLLFVICADAFCNAQQAICTAGGEATGAGGTVSFTLGQTDCITVTSNSGLVMQGIQQPFEIMVVNGIESKKEITLECMAYPNPVTDFLTLKILNDRIENLSYRLLDMNGKLLEERPIGETETSISLQHYLSTTYFLIISYNTKEIKTFKITKN
jgi:Secretion system C-terminal sorting domain